MWRTVNTRARKNIEKNNTWLIEYINLKLFQIKDKISTKSYQQVHNKINKKTDTKKREKWNNIKIIKNINIINQPIKTRKSKLIEK